MEGEQEGGRNHPKGNKLLLKITCPLPMIFLLKRFTSDPETFNPTAVPRPENRFRKEMATQLNYTIITGHHCNTIYFFFVFIGNTQEHDPSSL